jgi:tRNA A-37 threonylcarbamoyl transferase component Bud32
MPEVKLCPECQAELLPGLHEELCPKCVLLHGIATTPGTPVSQKESDTPAFHGIFTPASPAELATHFPQLEILELLGQGGMGAVYKARQPGLDRVVALKILPPEAGRDPAFTERFTREARALARLNHPNIVTVFDFGQQAEQYYFLMEFVDGASLRQLLRAGCVQPPEAVRIAGQICDALQFAHEEGFVHRDIKPENILLDRKGRVKVADFGIAKLLGRKTGDYTLTGPWQVMGTLHYMAPEQMENPLGIDHRADLYSVGVLLYELLTRQLPLGRFAPPSQKVAVDPRLDAIVLRALESDPNQRYQQARDFKADLEAVGTQTTLAQTRTVSLESGWQEADYEWARRKVMAPGIGLLATGIFALLPAIYVPIGLIAGHSDTNWLLVVCGASGVVGVTIILGVVKMLRLEWLPLATTASILAMLPITPGCFLGLPMGLWAFVTLQNPRLIAAFRRQPWQPPRTGTGLHLTPPRPALRSTLAAERRTPTYSPAPPTQEYSPSRAEVATVLPIPQAPQTINPTASATPVPTPLAVTPDETKMRAACKEMYAPGTALAIYGFVQFLSFIGVIRLHVGGSEGLAGLAAVGWLAAPVIVFGGWKMRRLEAHAFCQVAAVLALISFPLGTAFGIWALVKLLKPEVREAFRLRRMRLRLRRFDPDKMY